MQKEKWSGRRRARTSLMHVQVCVAYSILYTIHYANFTQHTRGAAAPFDPRPAQIIALSESFSECEWCMYDDYDEDDDDADINVLWKKHRLNRA